MAESQNPEVVVPTQIVPNAVSSAQIPVTPQGDQGRPASEGGIPTVKKSYLSKTLWTNLLLAVLALAVPGIHDWVWAHPEYLVYAYTLVNFVLRKMSKDKVELW